MSQDVILYDVMDGVATITANRPEARNAFTIDMVVALHAASVKAAEDPGVRAIVLTGAGGHFAAGADVKLLGSMLAAEPHQESAAGLVRELTFYFHGMITTLARAGKPWITAVDGTAAGGGFSLAIAADVTIASEQARFTYAYSGIGLTPDGSASWSLPRLIGMKRAMWLALRNPTLTAADALQLGLVTEVVPAELYEARWRMVACELAAGPTGAHAAVKRLLRGSYGRDLEAQLEDERAAILHASRSADFREGVEAFVGKRRPRFGGVEARGKLVP